MGCTLFYIITGWSLQAVQFILLRLYKHTHNFLLTLISMGGRRNHHPLSENRNISGTEHPIDLRPVCELESVRCRPVEKKQRVN